MGQNIEIQRSASLRDQVINAFLSLLSEGEFTPGSRITELALAQRLQVSRTPIREALSRLVQRGVLEHRYASGYFVPIHTADEIRDVIAVRMLLEPPAVREATKQFDAKQLRALDQSIQGQEKAAVEENTQKFMQANAEFREAIFGSLANKVLRSAIAQFDPHLQYLRSITTVTSESCAILLERERQIRDAMAGGKAALAESLYKRYLQRTQHWMLQLLQASEAAQATERPSMSPALITKARRRARAK